jgi:hypothetical protein
MKKAPRQIKPGTKTKMMKKARFLLLAKQRRKI